MENTDNQRSLLIVAAEISSSLYAQRLLEHWNSENRKVQSFGVGCSEMEGLGFERLGKSEEMAVMGIAEVWDKYLSLRDVFYKILKRCDENPPSCAILMDYPGFNLRLAKELHRRAIPVVYYISPQVWAWKHSRVRLMKKYCNEILVVFPFEVDFFNQFGISTQFVGHPLMNELKSEWQDEKKREQKRQRFGWQEKDLVIGLMPGSRKKEILHHFQMQMNVAQRLLEDAGVIEKVRTRNGSVKVAVLIAPGVDKSQLQQLIPDSISFPFVFLQEEPFEMIHLCDILLVASGTASLMVGLLEKPMVIMYKFHWLTGWIAKWIVKGVAYFGIVNLIMGKELVPERWQNDCTEEVLTHLMKRYIEDPEYKKQVIAGLKELKHRLVGREHLDTSNGSGVDVPTVVRVTQILESRKYIPFRSTQ